MLDPVARVLLERMNLLLKRDGHLSSIHRSRKSFSDVLYWVFLAMSGSIISDCVCVRVSAVSVPEGQGRAPLVYT